LSSPKQIKRLEAIEVYSNYYGTLFDDRVVAPNGTKGRYLRWHWAANGIVVIPSDGEAIALTRNYRYPIGGESLEFPRGAGGELEKIETAAARELKEETGLQISSIENLGEIFPETGIIENPMKVVLARVDSRKRDSPNHEAMESISKDLLWLRPSELNEYIKNGKIRCGISLAALLLLQNAKIFSTDSRKS
jgi:8-oxo-dGTP pyrophosphatase MutT (NUDIX family)